MIFFSLSPKKKLEHKFEKYLTGTGQTGRHRQRRGRETGGGGEGGGPGRGGREGRGDG